MIITLSPTRASSPRDCSWLLDKSRTRRLPRDLKLRSGTSVSWLWARLSRSRLGSSQRTGCCCFLFLRPVSWLRLRLSSLRLLRLAKRPAFSSVRKLPERSGKDNFRKKLELWKEFLLVTVEKKKLYAVLRIRIRSYPKHFGGSGSRIRSSFSKIWRQSK